MFGKRILILAPHPDDEVVGCAAAIDRARAQGAVVSVLFLTNGCLAREARWPWDRAQNAAAVERRRAEAMAAASFFGFTLLNWPSRATRRVCQDWHTIADEAAAAIKALKPDQCWLPAYEGGHPDHDAANALPLRLPTPAASAIPVFLEYAEYNFKGRRARPQCFPNQGADIETLTLTEAEKERKAAGFALYASESRNLRGLLSGQEQFRPWQKKDYTKPPHKGVLWYRRFSWIPFPHPAINRLSPKDVAKAISAGEP